MHFEGSVPIRASREKVWAFVIDPEQVGQCGPGVEKIEVVDDSHFKATAKVGIGFISARFVVDMTFAELVAPDKAVIKAHGQAPGSAVDADASMNLSDGPDGTTVMDWKADVNLAGTLASMGARLIEGTANKMIGQTFDCMRDEARGRGLTDARPDTADGAPEPGRRAGRDERPHPRRPAHPRGDRHRHRDPVAALDRRRAGGARLDVEAHRLDPRPLGSHRRQRRAGGPYRRGHRRPSRRSRPAGTPATDLGAVRHRAIGPRGRARRGRRDPVRRDPTAGPAHARPHRGLGLPARRGRRHPLQRRHAVRGRLGTGRLPRWRRRTPWSRRSPASPAWRTRPASTPGTARRRRSGASGPGWSSFETAAASSSDG